MKTKIKVEDTRFPRMTRSILRNLDREQLEDVARHGADAGWSSFTYYTDTCAFYKAHKGDILKLAEQMAGELGEDMLAHTLETQTFEAQTLEVKIKIKTGLRTVLQIGAIGSRNDFLLAFNTNAGIQIQASCFFGSIEDFESKVKKTHKGTVYKTEYEAAVKFIKTVFEASEKDEK